jgi:hypothetical protein
MTPSGEDKRPKRASSGGARSEKASAKRERPRRARTAQQSEGPPSGERGVLSSLPSTRPQRPSARRAAARSAAARSAAAKGGLSTAGTASAKRTASAAKRTASPTEPTGTATNAARAGTKDADPAARERARARTRTRRPAKRTTGTTAATEPAERTTTDPRTAMRRTPPRPITPPRQTPLSRTNPIEPLIPQQGFETEEEIAPGSTVQPPNRPELAAAVADLLGELAQGGLTAGGRLLKDVLGRLPGV